MNHSDVQSPSNFLNSGKPDFLIETSIDRDPESWRNFRLSSLLTPIMNSNRNFYAEEPSSSFNNAMRVVGEDLSTVNKGKIDLAEKKDESFTSLSIGVDVKSNPTPKLNLSLIDEIEQKNHKGVSESFTKSADSTDSKMLHDAISNFLSVQRRKKASIKLILDHVRIRYPEMHNESLNVIYPSAR